VAKGNIECPHFIEKHITCHGCVRKKQRHTVRRSIQKIDIDTIHRGWYFSSMKIKTSITLSDEVLRAIDLHIGEYKSRSEFLETAARKFIVQLARKEAEQRDLEIINRRADSLNAEAEDVLSYQVPL
jgi:Arc/MetJ-type ribon-helix-helix transcriptional regulator